MRRRHVPAGQAEAQAQQKRRHRQHRDRQHERAADGLQLSNDLVHSARAPAPRFQKHQRADTTTRQVSVASARTCALSCGINVGTTDSSVTPRAEQHRDRARIRRKTTTHRDWRAVQGSAARGGLDEPQHRRMQTADARGELGVTAIHRQRVLREIIGANREKVDLARNRIGEHGRGRRFDHGAECGRRHSETGASLV